MTPLAHVQAHARLPDGSQHERERMLPWPEARRWGDRWIQRAAARGGWAEVSVAPVAPEVRPL